MDSNKEAITEGTIVNISEVGSLKSLEKGFKDTYFGVFYAIEYRSYLRIAATKCPYTAITALIRQNKAVGEEIKDFGSVFISPAHTNYKRNEHALHDYFSESFNGGAKLYRISLKDFVIALPKVNLEYRDETDEIEARCQRTLETFKKLLFGGQL